MKTILHNLWVRICGATAVLFRPGIYVVTKKKNGDIYRRQLKMNVSDAQDILVDLQELVDDTNDQEAAVDFTKRIIEGGYYGE